MKAIFRRWRWHLAAWCLTLLLIAGALVVSSLWTTAQPEPPGTMTRAEAEERLARIHVGMGPTDVVHAIFSPERSKAILGAGPMPNLATVTGPYSQYVDGWFFEVTYSRGKVVSKKMVQADPPTPFDWLFHFIGL